MVNTVTTKSISIIPNCSLCLNVEMAGSVILMVPLLEVLLPYDPYCSSYLLVGSLVARQSVSHSVYLVLPARSLFVLL